VGGVRLPDGLLLIGGSKQRAPLLAGLSCCRSVGHAGLLWATIARCIRAHDQR
jgi:hypothetical protein